jgi:4-amino-4-deoxy-L-arabinose transferase-like glycosyltransferase
MGHRATENSESASVRVPEKSIAEWGVALLLFVVPCLYLRLFYDYTILNADEGIVLQGAQRILQGQVLYRDFFSFYTPGSYYWMALLFKIFGSSILVARAALIVYGGLFSVLTYLLARRVCSRWSALLACYLVTVSCLRFGFMALHNWDSTLLAYLTLYCAVLLLERPHWAWALGTGSFAALTSLFEHSKGAGLVLGLLVGYLVIVIRGHRPSLFETRRVAGLGAGFAWPFVVTFSYFAAKHSVLDMLTDWVWPLFHYAGANRLPYGFLVMGTADRTGLFAGSWGSRLIMLVIVGPFILLPVLPILALGILAWFAFKGPEIEPARPSKWAYWVLVSASLGGLLFSTFLTKRPDFTHLNYLGPLFYLVVAWVLDGLNLQSRLWRSVMPVLVLLIFFSYTAFGMTLLWGPLGAHHKVRTARGMVTTGGPDAALDYVQAHVTPGEKLFVYPYEPLYYYLTGTFNPTRFDFLQPGMHTSEQVQEAIGELAADRTRVVLFELNFSKQMWLAWPDTPIGVIAARDPVVDYIFARYRPCAALAASGFWRFVFMVRKEDSCK